MTILPDEESEFWLKASQTSLAAVWDNDEDDIYAQQPIFQLVLERNKINLLVSEPEQEVIIQWITH